MSTRPAYSCLSNATPCKIFAPVYWGCRHRARGFQQPSWIEVRGSASLHIHGVSESVTNPSQSLIVWLLMWLLMWLLLRIVVSSVVFNVASIVAFNASSSVASNVAFNVSSRVASKYDF